MSMTKIMSLNIPCTVFIFFPIHPHFKKTEEPWRLKLFKSNYVIFATFYFDIYMLELLDRKKHVLKIRRHTDTSEGEAPKLPLTFKTKLLSTSERAVSSEPDFNVILEIRLLSTMSPDMKIVLDTH